VHVDEVRHRVDDVGRKVPVRIRLGRLYAISARHSQRTH
jgi:hypothetical protein